MKTAKTLLTVLCALAVMGCSSLLSRTGTGRGTGKLYPGTREDAGAIVVLGSNRPDASMCGAYAFYMTFAIIDLPLSFVVDTVCLPYDIATYGRHSEVIYYGRSSHRVCKVDRDGLRHGKNPFKFQMEKNGVKPGTISGFVRYKHGTLHGRTEVRGIGERPIAGRYLNGRPWSGGILLGATDLECQTVGPLCFYENGQQVWSSNIMIVLPEGRRESWP